MTLSRKSIIFYFALLYFVQGAAQSFFRNFQKPYLSDLGISAEQIGLLSSMLLLPFIIKVIFGYISDRFNLLGFGHRKPYLFLGLFIAIIGFGLGSVISAADNYTIYAIMIVCAAFGVALFDATADGLAIEISAKKDQGLVQSAMISGKSAGFIIISLLIGYLATHHGFSSVYILLAAITLVPVFLIPMLPEREVKAENTAKSSDFIKLFNGAFVFFIIYALTYTYASFGIDGLITYYLRQIHSVSDDAIGNFGATSGVGAVIGALCAGFSLAKFNNFKIAIISSIGVAIGGLLAAYYLNADTMILFAVAWGFVWAFQETVFVTYAMRFSQNHIAASTFALLMVFSNIGQALSENFSTTMSSTMGFQNVFLILSAVCILPIIALKISMQLKKS